MIAEIRRSNSQHNFYDQGIVFMGFMKEFTIMVLLPYPLPRKAFKMNMVVQLKAKLRKKKTKRTTTVTMKITFKIYLIPGLPY